jgi:hypothetical protein
LSRVDAAKKQIDAGNRDIARKGRGAVESVRFVSDATGPAGLTHHVGNRCLKEPDLIRVREELQRLFAGAILISRSRQRFNQWTVVAEHGEFSLIEQVLHLRHVRMKTVGAAAHR